MPDMFQSTFDNLRCTKTDVSEILIFIAIAVQNKKALPSWEGPDLTVTNNLLSALV